MSGHVVAIGGGSLEETEPLLRYILGLARADRPRVCCIPTTSGDSPTAIAASIAQQPGSGAPKQLAAGSFPRRPSQ